MHEIIRGAATGTGGLGGGLFSPTIKSKGTSYVLVPAQLLPQNVLWLIGPLHTHHRSSAPTNH